MQNNDNFSIYMAYHELSVRSVVELMVGLDDLSENIATLYRKKTKSDIGLIPPLSIENIHTGESVKFTFSEGWLPSLSSDAENDIIVGVPKKIGIPIIIGYLLLQASNQVLEMRNKMLDNHLKKIEIQLKEKEVDHLVQSEDSSKYELDREARNIIRTINRNKNFYIVQVNDITIIDNSSAGK